MAPPVITDPISFSEVSGSSTAYNKAIVIVALGSGQSTDSVDNTGSSGTVWQLVSTTSIDDYFSSVLLGSPAGGTTSGTSGGTFDASSFTGYSTIAAYES